MMYDTNDDPAEHDCAWFEEEVQRLRSELESARAVVRAAVAHTHQCDSNVDEKDDLCDAIEAHLASFPVESGS